MIYFKYLAAQKWDAYNILVAAFILLYILGGNDTNIGLGFISLNALISFFIIAIGFTIKEHRWDTPSVIIFLIIFISILYLLVFHDSFISLYSICGNVLLAWSIAKRVEKGVLGAISVAVGIGYSYIFFSYYLGINWGFLAEGTLIDLEYIENKRKTFNNMNPNGVSELITLSVISLLFIYFRQNYSRTKPLKLSNISTLFILLAIVPQLQLASRKGSLLFVLTILFFYFLAFGFKNISKILLLSISALVILFPILTLLPFNISSAAGVLEKRWGEESLEKEGGVRFELLNKGITKGLEHPILGHGMSSSRNERFLKESGLWNYQTNSPVNTHNGFINIFLNGGLLLLFLYLILFGSVFIKLGRLLKKVPKSSKERYYIIICILYNLIFIAHILSSGNGELFKLGWMLFGLSLGIIWNKNQILFPQYNIK